MEQLFYPTNQQCVHTIVKRRRRGVHNLRLAVDQLASAATDGKPAMKEVSLVLSLGEVAAAFPEKRFARF